MSSEVLAMASLDLPDLPAGWSWRALRDLVEPSRGICYGIVQPGAHDPCGVPMVNTGDVLNGHAAQHIHFRVSRALHEKYQRSTLRGGELLVTLVGANFGRVAIAPSHYSGHNCSRAVAVVPVREDAEYVMLALRSPLSRRFMDTWANTTAQPTFNLKELGNLPVPIPPSATKREIRTTLMALDDRIALLRDTNATLEAIAEALFKSWFIDFDPVRAKSRGLAPAGMDEATAALFPDRLAQLAFGSLPKGWSIQPLGDWLDVLETGRRPKGGVGGIHDGVPSIGAESIIRVGQFDFGKTKFVSKDFFASMRSGALQSHDVLLYKDGGKPGVFLPRVSMFGDGFPFNICGINEHVFRMRSKAPMGQTFLYFLLWSDSVMHELRHRGGKAAIPGINQSDVRAIKVQIPTEPILRRYEELTAPLIASILNNAKRSQMLQDLRDTLLPRLISGQLRLPEAEAEAELETA